MESSSRLQTGLYQKRVLVFFFLLSLLSLSVRAENCFQDGETVRRSRRGPIAYLLGLVPYEVQYVNSTGTPYREKTCVGFCDSSNSFISTNDCRHHESLCRGSQPAGVACEFSLLNSEGAGEAVSATSPPEVEETIFTFESRSHFCNWVESFEALDALKRTLQRGAPKGSEGYGIQINEGGSSEIAHYSYSQVNESFISSHCEEKSGERLTCQGANCRGVAGNETRNQRDSNGSVQTPSVQSMGSSTGTSDRRGK